MFDRLEAPMNEVLEKCGSLASFLADRESQDEYFSKAQKLFCSESLTRESFERLLSQIRNLIEKRPEFEGRLWNPKDTSSMQLEVSVEKTRSFGVDSHEWEKFRELWREKLRSKIAGAYPLDDRSGFVKKARPLLALLRAETETFRKSIQGKDRHSKIQAEHVFFRDVRNREEIIQIAATSVYQKQEAPQVDVILKSQNAAEILNLFRSWYQNTRDNVQAELAEFAGPLFTVLRDQLPKYAELKRNRMIFSEVTENRSVDQSSNSIKKGVYRFGELSRPIHDLWASCLVNDCLAFDSKFGGPVPNRWALIAQKGLRTLHIRTESAYYGAIYIRPIERKGQTWGCLEIWSPILSLVPIRSDTPHNDASFFEIFFEKIIPQLPSDWKGICIGFNPPLDNFASSKLLKKVPIVANAKSLGHAAEFKLADSIFDKFPEVDLVTGPFNLKGVQMIYSAMPRQFGKTQDIFRLFER